VSYRLQKASACGRVSSLMTASFQAHTNSAIRRLLGKSCMLQTSDLFDSSIQTCTTTYQRLSCITTTSSSPHSSRNKPLHGNRKVIYNWLLQRKVGADFLHKPTLHLAIFHVRLIRFHRQDRDISFPANSKRSDPISPTNGGSRCTGHGSDHLS
jgi:hypothetical protein